MLHLIYILAFTVIAFFAISNLIRSLITISADTRRGAWSNQPRRMNNYQGKSNYHPELFDEEGKPVNEPLLVIRSVSVEDARQQLDSIYNASPSQTPQVEEES